MKWLILSLALLGQPLWAASVTPGLSPAAEARYKALIAELRCLVCQNQSLLDSDASLAMDLRREVLKLIESGQSDAQIVDFLVARYGDFVLYRPPLKATTVLLWGGPFLLLVVGLGVAGWWSRRLGTRLEEAPAPEQLAKLRALTGEGRDA